MTNIKKLRFSFAKFDGEKYSLNDHRHKGGGFGLPTESLARD